jgi:hypothetical protein
MREGSNEPSGHTDRPKGRIDLLDGNGQGSYERALINNAEKKERFIVCLPTS